MGFDVHKKYSEKEEMGNRTYDTNNRQYKALIWDYHYTELKLSNINYNNLVMTSIHSCIQNNTKQIKVEVKNHSDLLISLVFLTQTFRKTKMWYVHLSLGEITTQHPKAPLSVSQ